MKCCKKRLVSICLVITMCAAFCAGSPATPVTATTSSSAIKDEINALQAEKEKIDNQLNALKTKQNENNGEITNIISEKNTIDQEINLLSNRIDNINAQLAVYNRLIADKQEELDAVSARYEQLKERYIVRIRAMEEGGDLSYWQIIFKSNSFSDFLDRINMIQEIAAADKRCMEELHNAANEVNAAREVLLREKEKLLSVKKEIEESERELEEKKVAADLLLLELLSRSDELDGLQAELEAMEEEFLKQIANKEIEYDEAKKKEWEEMNAGKPPVGDNAGWLIPCSYVYLSSPFGNRDAPVAGASTYHQGVDLAAYRGTPVYATRSGIVSIADHGWSAGNYVQIDHLDGYKSIYMHLETYCVSAGDIVSAGQQIGTVGTSGVSSGYHLHFGISYQGIYVNPCEYVKLN